MAVRYPRSHGTIDSGATTEEKGRGMHHFDGDYAEELVARLAEIPEDAQPRWGDLTRDTLIEHLIWTLRHSMGRSRTVPFVGNRMTRYVARPLILAGVLPLTKRSTLSRALSEQGLPTRESGDLETLHALVEEYLGLVQADELAPAPHPTLGQLGIDGWDRFHVLHFEHHLKQFGT
jgi:hydroxymethylglutaryl-CoA reductase